MSTPSDMQSGSPRCPSAAASEESASSPRASSAAASMAPPPLSRSEVPPTDGCCLLLDRLDEELLACVGCFLRGVELVALCHAAPSLRLNSLDWLWAQLAAQEFSRYDSTPMLDEDGQILPPSSSSSTASAAIAASAAAALSSAASTTASVTCRATRSHRFCSLDYPIDAIAAHVIASADSTRAELAARTGGNGGGGADVEPNEDEMRFRFGRHNRQESVPLGAEVPCHLVRVHRWPWTWRGEGTGIEPEQAADSSAAAAAAASASSSWFTDGALAPAMPSLSPSPSPSPCLHSPTLDSSTRTAIFASQFASLHATAHPTLVRWIEQRSELCEQQLAAAAAGARRLREAPAIEAHALVAVGHGQNVMLCVAGFSAFGPVNDVLVRRWGPNGVWRRAASSHELMAAASVTTTSPPHFPLLDGADADRPSTGLYGAPTIALDEKHVLIVSGYRHGGYSGQSRRCYMLKLIKDGSEEHNNLHASEPAPAAISAVAAADAAEAADPTLGVHLLWVPLPSCARMLPRAHCYGSIAFHPGSSDTAMDAEALPPRVFLFGGIDDSGCHNALSVLDMRGMTWSSSSSGEMSAGNRRPPPAMHSHLCAVVGDTLWILGGATGSDPPRSGHDLQRVYSLDLRFGGSPNAPLQWMDRTDQIAGRKPKLNRRQKAHALANNILIVGVDEAAARPKKTKERSARNKNAGTQRNHLSTHSSAAAANPAEVSATSAAAGGDPESDSEDEAQEESEDELDAWHIFMHARRREEPHAAGVVVLDLERMCWRWPRIAEPGGGESDPGQVEAGDENAGTRKGEEPSSAATPTQSAGGSASKLAHAPLFPRFASASVHRGAEVWLYGGCRANGHTLNDSWLLRLDYALSTLPSQFGRFEAWLQEERALLDERRAAASASAPVHRGSEGEAEADSDEDADAVVVAGGDARMRVQNMLHLLERLGEAGVMFDQMRLPAPWRRRPQQRPREEEQ